MKLHEALKANQFTIAELEAVLEVLDRLERNDTVAYLLRPPIKSAMAKMRWHIAASRNEVEYS